MRNCVLVVERDPSVSRFMQLKLEEEGFSCLVDNIGDSVVDLAGQRQVDIIVLDPDDPMEDGDKILENVREISMIPVIYLSSDGSVDRKVAVMRSRKLWPTRLLISETWQFIRIAMKYVSVMKSWI